MVASPPRTPNCAVYPDTLRLGQSCTARYPKVYIFNIYQDYFLAVR